MKKLKTALHGTSLIVMLAMSGCLASGGQNQTTANRSTTTSETTTEAAASGGGAAATPTAAASALAFVTQPSSTGTAGTALGTQPVVEIRDSAGSVFSSTDSVTLSAFTDPSCSIAAAGTLSNGVVAASGGTATFTSLSYSKAETIYLKASSGTLTTACTSAGTTISAAAASTITRTSGNSQTGAVGMPVSSPMVVTITDSYGNAVSGTTVTWAVTSGGGSLAAGTNPSNASGGSSATLTLGAVAGANSASASVAGLSGSPVSFSATGSAPGVAVALVFTTQPSTTGTAATNLGTQPVVEIRDSIGSVVSSTDTVTLTAFTDSSCLNAAAGTLNNGSVAASGGVATFATVNYTKAETIYLKASSGSLTTACTSAGIAISAGTAATIAKTSGDTQTGTAGAAVSSPMVVTVTDAYGNPVSGTTVTWAVASGGGSLAAGTNPSTALGTSSSTLTLGTTAGANSATATVVGLAGSPLTFNATGVAGSATKVAYSVLPSSSVVANSSLGTQPQVLIQDANNNTVNSTATVSLTAYTDSACSTTLAGGTLGSNSMSAVAGTAAFSGVNYNTAETIYLRASSGSLTIACSNAIAVSSAATAPSSCTYAMAAPTYAVGSAITANPLTCAGSAVTSCASGTTLPDGLSLASNCQLTGTPTATQNSTSYTITATNAVGSTTAPISITILPAAAWDTAAVVAGVTLSNSNLKASIVGAKTTRGNRGKSAGKWYWEVTIDQNATSYSTLGIVNSSASMNTYTGAEAHGWGMSAFSGSKYNSGVGVGFGTALTVGNVIGFALDATSGTITAYKNGTQITGGAMYSIAAGATYYPSYSNTWASTTEAATAKFIPPFTHTPPSGYVGIGELATLADPVISTPTAGASAGASTTFIGTCVANSTLVASASAGMTIGSATCNGSGVLSIAATLSCSGTTGTSRVLSVYQVDASGNYSNTVTRSVEFSTTCVRWASLGTASVTLSNANLTAATAATSTARADTGKSSGKWYWEITINTVGAAIFGVATADMTLTDWPGHNLYSWAMSGASGDKYYNNTLSTYAGASGQVAINDVVGVAFDADNGVLYLYKNGVQLPTSGAAAVYSGIPTGVTYYPVFGNSYAPYGTATGTAKFNAPFTYTPPTGYTGF